MIKYTKIVLLIIVLAINTSNSQRTHAYFEKADLFFKSCVQQGRVNYKNLIKNPALLNDLINEGKSISVNIENPAEFQAFWINAYNILVIQSVVENYPLKSPLDKVGFFDKTKHQVGGMKVTLNDIENKLLRGNFPKEARFHFVLVCAGIGCPPIIERAYFPETLEDQLEEQTKLAINNPDFIQVSNAKVKISQIFEWYKKDFEQDGKKTLDFINRYKTTAFSKETKFSYYAYDWRLNEIN